MCVFVCHFLAMVTIDIYFFVCMMFLNIILFINHDFFALRAMGEKRPLGFSEIFLWIFLGFQVFAFFWYFFLKEFFVVNILSFLLNYIIFFSFAIFCYLVISFILYLS